MPVLSRRGETYYYSRTLGPRRYRVSLGTTQAKVARQLSSLADCALVQGPRSDSWRALRQTLPSRSLKILGRGILNGASPELSDFERRFYEKLDRREKLDEISGSTAKLYTHSAELFFGWLHSEGVRLMDEVDADTVDRYRVWRKEKIDSTPQGWNGASLQLDRTVMSAIFDMAVEEHLIPKSPLSGNFKPSAPVQGAEPFSRSEMGKLEAEAAKSAHDDLIFHLFRYTGLRGSDAAELRWSAVNLADRTLRWQTRKRKNWVIVPLVAPLAERLKEKFASAHPAPDDRILDGSGRAKLYREIKSLGERASVPNSHPHRFRDFLAVTMLEQGATLYDVAKTLGDSVSTIERHYAPYVDRLQERVRGILEKTA